VNPSAKSLSIIERALKTTVACNKVLASATSEDELLHSLCRVIVEKGGYKLAWVGYFDSDCNHSIRYAASAGDDHGYLEKSNVTWSDDSEYGRGPSGTAFRTGKIIVCNDFQNDLATGPWRKLAADHGFAASISLPLKNSGHSFGVMMIYALEVNAFSSVDIELLSELADNLAFGIQTQRVYSQRNCAETALMKSENQARKKAQFLKSILESSHGIIMFSLDRAYRYTEFTAFHKKTMKTIWGVDIEIGMNMLDVISSPADSATAKRNFDRTFQGNNQVIEEEYGDSAIQRTWYENRYSPILDDSNEVIGLTVFVIDISERKRIETALLESAQHFRTLADSGQALIWTSGMDKKCNYFNRVWLEFTGRKLEQELGDGWAEGVHPDDLDSCFRTYVEAFEQEKPFSMDYRLRRHDGEYRWLQDEGTPRYNSGGAFLGYIGHCLDITDRKQAEEMRVKYQRSMTLATEATGVGIWEWNITTNKIRWDAQMFQIYGLVPTDDRVVPYSTWSGAVLPEDLAKQEQEMQKTILRKTLNTREFRIRRLNDREMRYIQAVETVHTNEQGVVESVVGTNLDITESKKQSEIHDRLATAVEQASENIMITTPDGAIIYVNPAFEKITGYAREEVLGRNPRLLSSGKQDADFYRTMWKQISSGKTWKGLISNQHKNGTIYVEETSISPIFNSAGKIMNYVGVKRDISREIQLETQFYQSQKMEAVGLLAGGVAHDFNNILGAIFLQAELIEKTNELPDSVRMGTREILVSAERASNLTRQLLLFSRKQVMDRKNVDLNDVIPNLLNMLQRIIGEDIRIIFKPSTCPLITHADQGMLDQVLLNLCVNARDAMPSGGSIVIETGRKEFTPEEVADQPDTTSGCKVFLSVTDTGCGIASENLSHIFEPFFTTKDVSKGTGLGLATVFGIVKQHHAFIDVKSEIGKGTAFQIFFPEAKKPDSAQGPSQDKKSGITPKVRGGKETILFVEDDSGIRLVTQIVLENAGYKVLPSTNGVEALQVWERHKDSIDLLLTDIVMPEHVSGRELAEQLTMSHPGLRVIFTSGYSREIAGRDLSLQSGQNYIQKPYTGDQLLNIVRTSLDHGKLFDLDCLEIQ